MKKFKAFTLAEVLIVLTIIGVVAALTMPVLNNKINDKILETQHKKAQAVLANGIKMMIAKNNTPYLKNTNLKKCRDNAQCIANEIKKEFKVVDDNLSSANAYKIDYELDDSDYQVWNDANFDYVFTVADGSTFGIMQNEANRTALLVYVDPNGKKNPNTVGRDFCSYIIDQYGNTSEINCDTRFERSMSREEQACMMQMAHYNCQRVFMDGECLEECSQEAEPVPAQR